MGRNREDIDSCVVGEKRVILSHVFANAEVWFWDEENRLHVFCGKFLGRKEESQKGLWGIILERKRMGILRHNLGET